MKRLNIDYARHMDYSKTARKGIRRRLNQKYSVKDSMRILEEIDRTYEIFLTDLPYCGGKHNVMIWQLYDAISAFAYWEVLPEKESLEEFAETCKIIFGQDRKRKRLPRILTAENQNFLNVLRVCFRLIAKKMNRALDSGKWQDGWRIELETDHHDEGIQVALIGCPIYNFAVKHGYEALMPAMCNCDFPGIDFFRAGLIRPRTVSNHDDRCDNWYVSLSSDKLKQYPPFLQNDGLLISRDWRE